MVMTDYFDDGQFLVIVFVCYIRITDHCTEHDIDSISILIPNIGGLRRRTVSFCEGYQIDDDDDNGSSVFVLY